MSEVTILELNNIGVRYRRKKNFFSHEYFWAISNISLEIYNGETLGVIGRNGAGKSTLLSLLSGIIAPDSGTIQYMKNGFTASLLSLQPGFVGQLSGRSNILLGGLLLGMERRQINEILDEIISFSELGSFIDQPFYTYSSGMRARLGFSLAIHANPDIILVDEVLGVGDIGFREKTSNVIRNFMSSQKTVVLVSHNINVIREHCNRVVWLENGQVRTCGSPDTILSEYEKHFKVKSPSQGLIHRL